MAALTSKEPIVRQNAVDELDELNFSQALPAIKRLLRDKDRSVRQAARTAVRNLEEAGRIAHRAKAKRRVSART
jgi:HEAT repeat protein